MADSDFQGRLMRLSLLVAVLLLGAKVFAAAVTGSAAIYSDAAESVAHLLAVGFAVWALGFSRRPADRSHHYGHDKVSYLSAGFEGAMITAAALLILYEAGMQVARGVEIRSLGLGAGITAAAALVNLVLGAALLRAGRRSGSPLLIANGQHVLTDVWTSGAVLLGLGLIALTGWPWWDPLVATLAALNISRTGLQLIRRSVAGLLDEADPAIERAISATLARECAARDLSWHNLRHRHSGRIHWVEFHLVCDDSLGVGEAHALATDVEAAVAALLKPEARVISHLEPRSAEHASERWEHR